MILQGTRYLGVHKVHVQAHFSVNKCDLIKTALKHVPPSYTITAGSFFPAML